MKKFVCLLFVGSFVLSVGYSQTNSQTTNVTTNIQTGGQSPLGAIINQKLGEGMVYLGNGQYKITEIPGSGLVSLAKIERRANEKMVEFVNQNNLKSKIISTQKYKTAVGVLPKVILIFQTFNNDGNINVSKEEAKKKLFEYKQLKDEGILTEEEYTKAAAPYKKIFLGL